MAGMGNVLAEWRAFGEYVRHPQPITPTRLSATGAWGRWGAILLFQTIGIILLGLAVEAWGRHFGIKEPEAFAKIPKALLPVLVVFIGPPLEEALFRGWLTGRPRALWLMGCAAVVVVGLGLTIGAHPALALAVPVNARRAVVLVLVALGLFGWFWLRWRPGNALSPIFAPVFWGSALAFAAMHIPNYDLSHGWPLLLMVVPQLWMGLVLGYARMRIGLPAAIGLHMANNALAFGLTLAGFK